MLLLLLPVTTSPSCCFQRPRPRAAASGDYLLKLLAPATPLTWCYRRPPQPAASRFPPTGLVQQWRSQRGLAARLCTYYNDTRFGITSRKGVLSSALSVLGCMDAASIAWRRGWTRTSTASPSSTATSREIILSPPRSPWTSALGFLCEPSCQRSTSALGFLQGCCWLCYVC